VPTRVETADPEGVDYGWVMQVTFVVTILVGSPVVALASTTTTLPTWGARAEFAIRVGAVVWLLTAVAVFAYARRRESTASGDDDGTGGGTDAESGSRSNSGE
jgi:hypothetical protein